MPGSHPPPEFTAPPKLPVIEHVVSWEEVQRICGSIVKQVLLPNDHWLGCGQFQMRSGTKVCMIWYTGDAATRTHEIGHCNGWNQYHKNGW